MFSMSIPTASLTRGWQVTAQSIARWCCLRMNSISGVEAEEERAVERGWQVERGRWGSRSYRDPRFDTLAHAYETSEPNEHDIAGGSAVSAVA